MAELILTEEEKASESYLSWDDASLGRACKKAMTEIKLATDDSERWLIYSQACASLLIGRAIDVNAAESNYGFKDFSVKGIVKGNWEVIVRKKMNPFVRLFRRIQNIFSPVENLTVTQKNVDGKMKTVDVAWKNRKETEEKERDHA